MKAAPAFELRHVPVIGTRYTEHSILVAGTVIHKQLSPYSEDEIEARINAHIRPGVFQPVKPDNWGAAPGRPKKDAKKYDWRTSKPEED